MKLWKESDSKPYLFIKLWGGIMLKHFQFNPALNCTLVWILVKITCCEQGTYPLSAMYFLCYDILHNQGYDIYNPSIALQQLWLWKREDQMKNKTLIVSRSSIRMSITFVTQRFKLCISVFKMCNVDNLQCVKLLTQTDVTPAGGKHQ